MTNVVASISLDRNENMHTADANITAEAGARGSDICGISRTGSRVGLAHHIYKGASPPVVSCKEILSFPSLLGGRLPKASGFDTLD